jgi:hypothetical protein
MPDLLTLMGVATALFVASLGANHLLYESFKQGFHPAEALVSKLEEYIKQDMWDMISQKDGLSREELKVFEGHPVGDIMAVVMGRALIKKVSESTRLREDVTLYVFNGNDTLVDLALEQASPELKEAQKILGDYMTRHIVQETSSTPEGLANIRKALEDHRVTGVLEFPVRVKSHYRPRGFNCGYVAMSAVIKNPKDKSSSKSSTDTVKDAEYNTPEAFDDIVHYIKSPWPVHSDDCPQTKAAITL